MIYVLSDIHGNERRFNSIMKQINLQPEDTLYVLGDVIDRHPDGIRILKTIMAMPNAKMILGNHEYMMLRALGHPYDSYDSTSIQSRSKAMQLWYRNGGDVTHREWKQLDEHKRLAIIEYIKQLPLNIDVEVNGIAYKLVHGAPVESAGAWEDPTYCAVWTRLSVFDTFPGDCSIIFGHTPTQYYQDCVPMELWYGEGKIGIDCGSGYPEGSPYGRLACLRLEDGNVFYSEEGYP